MPPSKVLKTFCSVGANDRHIAVTQNAPAAVLYGKGMGRVINHSQIVTRCDFFNTGDITRISIRVNSQNSRRSIRNSRFYCSSIKIQCFAIYINKGGQAVPNQRICSGRKRIGCCNYLSINTKRFKGK